MAFSLRVSCAFSMLLTALLSGCTGSQDANVRKDASYNKRLSDTVVVWKSQENFQMEIFRSKLPTASSPYSPPFVTEQDKIEARKGISELMALLSRHAVNSMGKVLVAAGVHVHPREAAAITRLVIVPVGSITGCAGASCEHTLKVQVTLFDKAESKEVWSGTFKVVALWSDTFKVGTPYKTRIDETVIKGFTDAVVAELKRSNML